MKEMIGLVGKPSSGKSTFFSAATEKSVKTAPYPFTTIDPNRGVTWVRVECPHTEISAPCNPRSGFCIKGNRFVPVEITDIAGLVEGAHEGRGMGSRFLDEIRREDIILQIVDASGKTDLEGYEGDGDPVKEVLMLRRELTMWIKGIVKKVFEKTKNYRENEREYIIYSKLSGLSVPESLVKRLIDEIGVSDDKNTLTTWAEKILATKTMYIVANKVDIPSAEEWVDILRKGFNNVVPASALAELILRKALRGGYVDYVPGDSSFKVLKPLNEEQKKALEIAEYVISTYGNTGVQRAIDMSVLERNIIVFPVKDENRWTDGEDNVLPDAYIVEKGSTALDLAFKIHSDIGRGFLYAVDARTKRKLGKDYELKHRDVIKIVSASR